MRSLWSRLPVPFTRRSKVWRIQWSHQRNHTLRVSSRHQDGAFLSQGPDLASFRSLLSFATRDPPQQSSKSPLLLFLLIIHFIEGFLDFDVTEVPLSRLDLADRV
jgi:hypothetical protein